jgi:hypothetical protein
MGERGVTVGQRHGTFCCGDVVEAEGLFGVVLEPDEHAAESQPFQSQLHAATVPARP